MEEDNKMTTDTLDHKKPDASNLAELREMSIVLDSWGRTCDIVLETLDAQINRIIVNNGKA